MRSSRVVRPTFVMALEICILLGRWKEESGHIYKQQTQELALVSHTHETWNSSSQNTHKYKYNNIRDRNFVSYLLGRWKEEAEHFP